MPLITFGRGAPSWRILRPSVAAWIAVFWLVNALVPLHENGNPGSRYALLCALVEDHSFRIDAYRDMTQDWARTPDGHYYSNKAPGPALLALPAFWAIDRWLSRGEDDRIGRDWRRRRFREATLHGLAFALQALPFGLLIGAAALLLAQAGVAGAAIDWFCLACLFGNTAALFQNTFFGHGMAALWTLALALALWRRAFALGGLCFGCAVLCDFGSAALLPGLLAALLVLRPRARDWGGFLSGGLAPGLLWTLYHVSAFGSPFVLPTRYQNPAFTAVTGHAWWGVIDAYPHPRVLLALLFGDRRGILWTQPWVLPAALALATRVRGNRERAAVAWLAGLGLGGLLAMNAAFGEWTAGNCPGPRYLCAIFPTLALAVSLHYERFSRAVRAAVWAGLVPALALYAIVFSTVIDADAQVPLWHFYADWLRNRPPPATLSLALTAGWLAGLVRSGSSARETRAASPLPSGAEPTTTS
jgi:hypothetical protein